MKKAAPASALSEKKGVSPPEAVNPVAAGKIRALREKVPEADVLSNQIISGNKTALSQGITLIESAKREHVEKAAALINACLPHSGKSLRIGITGVPGVGKSTFIESFGKRLTKQGKKVAVLAIDPSSTLSHGSILGDKTRMDELVKDDLAYIRPSASGEALGGVAKKTREAVILCEAAGFEVIIIETVGVGQSETAVHSMTDFFLLLKLSGAGDELQGIKRGIMEMADAVVINKADGDNIRKAELAKVEFNRALQLFPPRASGWSPKVTTASAITGDGIAAVWESILAYIKMVKDNGFFDKNRSAQSHYWMTETIQSRLMADFYENEAVKTQLTALQLSTERQEISPFAAAEILLQAYLSSHHSS